MAHPALEVNDADPPELRMAKQMARTNHARALHAEQSIDAQLTDIRDVLKEIRDLLLEED